MMLNFLGHTEASGAIVEAFETVLERGEVMTPDLGGNASTSELGSAIREEITGG